MLSDGMKTEDLRSLSQLGNALWLDRELSRKRTAETLEAVSLLSITEEAFLEKASSVLLARANREDLRLQAPFLGDPFFRLLPEERFLLVALHVERWSYHRVARILQCAEEQVATRAWKVRVHLASQPGSANKSGASKSVPVLGAVGVAPRHPSCPEFHSLNPWTQRFLDEEYASRERVFLQNHLMACDDCRHALNRCGELYYHVEKMIPRVEAEGFEDLGRMMDLIRKRKDPLLWTWQDAVRAFLRRPETQLLLLVILVWWAVALF